MHGFFLGRNKDVSGRACTTTIWTSTCEERMCTADDTSCIQCHNVEVVLWNEIFMQFIIITEHLQF